MTDIVVRLRRSTALAFLAGERHPDVTELKTVLARFGAELRQQHPGISDPQLQTYFTATVDSAGDAEQLAARLRELAAVEAAYPEPRPRPA